MKVKIVVVASAGVISGRMIRKKIRKCPQPSMRAASSSSRGMPRMNCTIRNTKNASVARNFGRISGSIVFTQPVWENMMYCGTITTWIGSIRVMSIIAKAMLRPQNRSRAKA